MLKQTELLKVAEVAKILRVSRNHVYQLIESGRVAAINIGISGHKPVYRIKREALEAFQKAEEKNVDK